MRVLRQMGVSARAPGSGQPGGPDRWPRWYRRPFTEFIILAPVTRITGHYGACFPCTPRDAEFFPAQWPVKPSISRTGLAGSISTVATEIRRKRSLVLAVSGHGTGRIAPFRRHKPAVCAADGLEPVTARITRMATGAVTWRPAGPRRRPRSPGRGRPPGGAVGPGGESGYESVIRRITDRAGRMRKAWRARPGLPITKLSRRDHAAELGRKKSVISCLRLSVRLGSKADNGRIFQICYISADP